MSILNEQQQKRAIVVMKEYLNAKKDSYRKDGAELDSKRVFVIKQRLKPLLEKFLEGQVDLFAFKSEVDSVNKQVQLWGFKGIKGQMFFNMVVNVAQEVDDINDCIEELKSVFSLPANENAASSRLKTFESYVNRLGDAWVNAGNTRYGCPKPNSIPFFVTYFWQLLDRDVWPVYYTASVQTMTDLNLWQPSGDIAKDYIEFKQIHEELIALFTQHSKETFDLYKVEHVFWFKGENPYLGVANQGKKKDEGKKPKQPTDMNLLPQSYIPPIIEIIPQIALNDDTVKKAAENSGISLENAFEKHINAAFKILGYDVTLLGQGKGRVPDGLAESHEENYAIIWDAKIRKDGFSIGTEDRKMREYIKTQGKRLRKFLNLYFVIISSSFSEGFEDIIQSIRMDTEINEVILLNSDALVAIVEAKLRDPLEISLGSDGIQRLLSKGGVITAKMVKEQLG